VICEGESRIITLSRGGMVGERLAFMSGTVGLWTEPGRSANRFGETVAPGGNFTAKM